MSTAADLEQSIEFSMGDDDDTGIVPDEATNGASKSKDSSLEQLLMGRNKKLTNELAVLRVSHRELQTQLENLQQELSRTKEELEKSQQLSATLENDLLRMQKGSNTYPSAAMSVAGTYSSRHHPSRRGGPSSPTSSIINGFDQVAAPSNAGGGEAMGGGSGILPMVQAQRDRFKQRNAELEEELSKTYETVKSLRQEVASLQRDNLNLYEKTRYMSTYSSATASNSSSAYGRSHASSASPSASSGLDRYQSAYEAQLSPFAAFRGREAARAYRRMSLPERLVFSMTRIILANRTSRNLFAGYCFALHVLLFIMLYKMTAVEIEKNHIDNIAGAAAAAAGGAGAGAGGGADDTAAQLQGDDWQQEGFH